MKAGGRLASVAALVVAILLAAAAPAGAALDPSFGEEGIVTVRSAVPGYRYPEVGGAAAVADGHVYVLETPVSCGPGAACRRAAIVSRLGSDGSLEAEFGEGGYTVVFDVPTFSGARLERLPRLATDSAGRALVVAYVNGGMKIYRLSGDGKPDPSFGEDGTVHVDCVCDGRIDISSLTGGAMMLAAGAGGYGEGEVFTRLSAAGQVEASYGHEPSALFADTGGAAIAPDGSAFTAEYCHHLLCPGVKERIVRVAPDGRADAAFRDRSARALRFLERHYGLVGSPHLIARPGGGLDLFGRFRLETSTGKPGARLRRGRGTLIARLNRDGGLDRRYGLRGVRRIYGEVPDAAEGFGLVDGASDYLVLRSPKEQEEEIGLPEEEAPEHHAALVRFAPDGAPRRPIRYALYRGGIVGFAPGGRPVVLTLGAAGIRSYRPPEARLLRLLVPAGRRRH